MYLYIVSYRLTKFLPLQLMRFQHSVCGMWGVPGCGMEENLKTECGIVWGQQEAGSWLF